MGVNTRRTSVITTGLTCTATAACAMLDAELKIYLTVWLYSFIGHTWLIALWLVRPDHSLLALARAKVQEARLNGALHEEAERHAGPNVTSLNRMFR